MMIAERFLAKIKVSEIINAEKSLGNLNRLAFISTNFFALEAILGRLFRFPYNFFEQFLFPNLDFCLKTFSIDYFRILMAISVTFFAVAQCPKLISPFYSDDFNTTSVSIDLLRKAVIHNTRVFKHTGYDGK